VDVDAGEHAARAQRVDHLARHGIFRSVRRCTTGPDAVVVGLSVENSQTVARGGDVADKQGERAWQAGLGIFAQYFPRRQPAGCFVAVQQDRNEQGSRASSRQMDQGGAGQDFMHLFGV